MFFFFFSSRRRHTRFSRDWSSDVCSSDLTLTASAVPKPVVRQFASRYIAGEETSDAVRVVKQLNAQKILATLRSEERRVGKESRAQWPHEDYKENDQKIAWRSKLGDWNTG